MEKWKGSFAQTQLEKFGWENGEGLGKNKEGSAKHISVSVKNDKKGVGVGQGQWEFAWWDHLYNKSASSVVVEKDEDKGEIKVATKSKGETRRSKTGIISTQRPTGKSVKSTEETTETTSMSMSSMADSRNMMDSVKDVHVNIAQRLASASLYGSFVKSATTSAAPTPGASDEEVDDELKDYSMKVTDAELFAACEGRTARKGGRGLVDQTGKFKRVMQDFVRPVDEDDIAAATNSKKRKNSDDKEDKKSAKKQKKAEKAARKEAKAAKKLEKAAKKEAKEAKKAAKTAKKAAKESKKAAKESKKSKD
ncbi:G patch domain-containing protein 4-like [Mucor ambiguus]|uniref:G patch domain-containing protein 4-like n=1 Tax=Mucor ambiguus TaxID=91626 RepID=A0A0C9MG62_9FUNG|nr:G patch domain-containing protein 4-like [Mucor ambiguus]